MYTMSVYACCTCTCILSCAEVLKEELGASVKLKCTCVYMYLQVAQLELL